MATGVFEKVGLSNKAEVKHQLFAYDADNSLEFRRLRIEMSHMVEDRDGKPFAAFWHKFKNEYWFPGYKNIPAGYITPGFERDTVLQVHDNIFQEDELPYTKDGKLDSGPISEIARNKCYELDADVKIGMVSNKILNTLIFIDIAMLLLLGIKVAF